MSGQFLGWASYETQWRCEICGEIGLKNDMFDHENYCQGEPEEEVEGDEFTEQSAKTIERMGDEN